MEQDPELADFAYEFETAVYAMDDQSSESIRKALEEVLPDYIAGSKIEKLMKVIESAKVAEVDNSELSRILKLSGLEVSEDRYDPELSAMDNSRDKVESTYAAIIKGDAEQSEVGDYIGKGMTKDQILKLIDMLEPQGYDKDFLLKDLAPMMEADLEEADEDSSEYIFLNADKGGIRVGGPGRKLYGWADKPKELAELFAKLGVNKHTRIMHSSDVDFASEEGFENDGAAHELIDAAIKMMKTTKESELNETTKKLKDELINELMGD